jgi:ribosome-associated protein
LTSKTKKPGKAGGSGSSSSSNRSERTKARGTGTGAGRAARASVTASKSKPSGRASSGGKPGGKPKRRAPSKAPFGPRSAGRVQTIGAAGAVPPAAPSPRKVRETAESLQAATAAIDAALDKKALLPVLIDVSSLASYTDFIGIVSGRSDRQVDAIADGILTAMKARGRSLLGQEGSGSGRWTLLDFGDVVIHVFYHPVREFYDLESLWVDAPRVQLRVPPEAVMAQPDALYGNL